MKNKYILFLLVLCICSFSFVKVNGHDKPLLGKIIYIDPGHGGVDPGSVYKNIKESEINLNISLLLREKLELAGATVYLTREGNYDLSSINATTRKRSDLKNRTYAINNSKADMYISIHLNSTTSSYWHGAQIFYDDVNPSNEKIAISLSDSLETDRKPQKVNNLYLNRNITIPGVLVEVGFLSNYYDRNNLINSDYQEKVADKIVKGLINYYKT